jgi:hypothetical protein
VDRSLRTITAACTDKTPGALIAQACAPTLASIGRVAPHTHVLGLLVIGLVLP